MKKTYTLETFKSIRENSMETKLAKLSSAIRAANPSWKTISTMDNHLFVVDEDTGEYFMMPYSIDEDILTVGKCEPICVETSMEIVEKQRKDAVKLFVESFFEGNDQSDKLFEGILDTVRYEQRAKTQPQMYGLSVRDFVGKALEGASQNLVEYVKTLAFSPSNSVYMGFSTNINEPQVSLGNFIENLPQLTKVAVARQSAKHISDSGTKMKEFIQNYLDTKAESDLDDVVDNFSAEWCCSKFDEKKDMLKECGLTDNFENTINDIDEACNLKYKTHIDTLKTIVETTFDKEYELALEFVDNTIKLEKLYGMDITEIRDTMQAILDSVVDRNMMSHSMVETFKTTIMGLSVLIEKNIYDPSLMTKAIHLMSQFAPLTFRPGANISNEVPGGLLDSVLSKGDLISEAVSSNPKDWLTNVTQKVKGFKVYKQNSEGFTGTIDNYVVTVDAVGLPSVEVKRGSSKALIAVNPNSGKYKASFMGDKETLAKATEILNSFYPNWKNESFLVSGDPIFEEFEGISSDLKKAAITAVQELSKRAVISMDSFNDFLTPIKIVLQIRGPEFIKFRDGILKALIAKGQRFESSFEAYMKKIGLFEAKKNLKDTDNEDPNADKTIDPTDEDE